MAYELVVFEAEFVELGFVGGIIFGGAGGLSDDEAAADGHAFVALPARAAQWNGASSVHNKNITCPGEKQKKELVTPGGTRSTHTQGYRQGGLWKKGGGVRLGMVSARKLMVIVS